VARLADADGEAGAQRRVAGGFFTVLVALQVLLLIAAVPVLRRARRPPTGHAPPAWPFRRASPSEPHRREARVKQWRRVGELLLVAAGLALPAALAADAVPWWRGPAAGLVFAGAWLALLAAGTAAVVASPLRRHTLGPTAGAAAIAAGVVMVDVISGGWLQLNGIAGYSALEGGRYAGLGTVSLGALVAGVMLIGGCLAQQVPRPWRAALVAGLGCLGVVVVGSPYLGSDAAGAVALTAGVCAAAVLARGGWLTLSRLGAAAMIGLAVTTAFAVLDLTRPPERRGSLGQFLTAVQEGTAGALVSRAGTANVLAVASSPLAVLAAVSAVYVFFVLMQPWGGLKRLFGVYPALRASVFGLTVAALLGGLLNGAGLTVAGAAAATALPLVTLAAIRALVHADERTVSPADARESASSRGDDSAESGTLGAAPVVVAPHVLP
jgi:hypothetical protein